MRKTILPSLLTSLSFVASVLASAGAHAGGPVAPGQGKTISTQQAKPGGHVDLVIALDTSSSMDGLIDAAREKLWDVVNVLNQAKPRPVVRVGLISYGNDGYPAADGWVRKDADLTTDLDSVYAKLFALHTNGGDEYVARAVTAATREMKWDQDQGTLRIVFVAGNEPANQDPKIPLQKALDDAREHHIFVNTIYCGSEGAGEARLWAAVAAMGHGRYAAIDHNKEVAVATPVDADLAKLSDELNKTYIGYGAQGGAGAAMQVAQDKNASTTSRSAAAARAAVKGSAMYDNSDWDLVDARKHGRSVAAMPATAMPAPMKAMAPAERERYVEEMGKRRESLQKEIAQKAAKRDEYLRAERGKRAKKGEKAFDDALDEAIKSEAQSAGYAF